MLPANLSKNIALFHWLMIILPHPFKNHFIGQFMIKKQKTLYQWTIILPMTYSKQFLPIHWIPSANDVILPYLTYFLKKNSFMCVEQCHICLPSPSQQHFIYRWYKRSIPGI